MTSPYTSGSFPTPQPHLQKQTAVTMLSMGLVGKHRPLDDLIDRLSRPDGQVWLQTLLRRQDRTLPMSMQSLLDGTASLDQLKRTKDISKSLIADAETREMALGALAVYCLSVAAALVHHGQLISSQSREEWDTLFVDLSAVMPVPWRDLLMQAALQQ